MHPELKGLPLYFSFQPAITNVIYSTQKLHSEGRGLRRADGNLKPLFLKDETKCISLQTSRRFRCSKERHQIRLDQNHRILVLWTELQWRPDGSAETAAAHKKKAETIYKNDKNNWRQLATQKSAPGVSHSFYGPNSSPLQSSFDWGMGRSSSDADPLCLWTWHDRLMNLAVLSKKKSLHIGCVQVMP